MLVMLVMLALLALLAMLVMLVTRAVVAFVGTATTGVLHLAAWALSVPATRAEGLHGHLPVRRAILGGHGQPSGTISPTGRGATTVG